MTADRNPDHFSPYALKRYTLDGVQIIPISRTCALRADGMIGRTEPWSWPRSLDDDERVRWYTPEQICQRAGIDKATLKARLADRWTFADLVKPPGRERLVEARRKGIPLPNGQRMTIKRACEHYGLSLTGIEYRIAAGWPWSEVIAIGRQERETDPVKVDKQAAKAENRSRAMYMNVRFKFDGAMDTLPGHAKHVGLKPATVRSRLRKGCTIEEALKPGRMARSDKGVPNPLRGYREVRPYG